MAKLCMISLGCNKNLVDSEVMLGRLKSYEITDDVGIADVIIINTCGFIGSAKEESIRTILQTHQTRKSDSLLVVTGCLIQRYSKELMAEFPEVDLFTGVGDYDRIDEIILKKQNLFSPTTYLQGNQERVITGSNYHAYIKISEGCNQKCSFCAIPNFKGRLKSRSLNHIIEEVKSLVASGYYDFSFLSQDSSSYQRDLGISDGLISLIDAIEKIEGVKSARILYLYPSTTSDALIDRIITSSVFHNYFDMPIQHISENLLKIMRRGSGAIRIKELLTKMRTAPNSFLRTGVIVGHPGESETDFDELCNFLTEFKFDRISAFAYSKEEDTASFKMQQIPTKTIEKRLSKLEEITQEVIDESFKADVGGKILVSIEGQSSEGEMFFGAKKLIWDKDIDGEILINDSDLSDIKIGQLYWCEITDVVGAKLIGRLVKKA